ncbi:20113_t:CDS:2, partial [Entrophospora sp. SA101]
MALIISLIRFFNYTPPPLAISTYKTADRSSDRANSQAPTSFSFWSGFKEEFISNIEDNLEFTRPSFVEAQVVSRETDIHRELDNNVWHIMNKITTEMNLGKFGTSSELLSQ